MKKILCSYGDAKYTKSLELLKKTALEIGNVDEVFLYDRIWLESTEFYKKNKYILDQKRGGGLWAYKYYCILETMKTVEDCIVMYTDAAIKIKEDLSLLYELADKGYNNGKILFKLPLDGVTYHLAKQWTKRDVFVLMNCDSKEYYEASMINGAMMLFTKNEENINFIKEWGRYCKDPRIITDSPNMCGQPNLLEFRDHRHDQSILTLLAKKHGLELFKSPCQHALNDNISKFDKCDYGQLVIHHRNNPSLINL